MHTRALVLAAVLTVWGAIAVSADAKAQETSDQEQVDPVLTQAQRDALLAQARRDEAQARQAEAEARRARVQALLPSSETSGITGNVSVSDGAGYYAEVLAYEALEDAVTKIAANVKGKVDLNISKEIILLGTDDLADAAARHSFIKGELERVSKLLNGIKNDDQIARYTIDTDDNAFENEEDTEFAASAILTALPQALGAVREISQFFQSNLSITNRSVTLDDGALSANLSGALLAQELVPIIPSVSTNVLGTLRAEINTLQSLRVEVSSMRLVADARSGKQRLVLASRLNRQRSSLAALQAELTALNAKQSKTEQEENRVRELQDAQGPIGEINIRIRETEARQAETERLRTLVLGNLDTAISAADGLITAITTPNDSGISPIQSVSVLDLIISKPDAYLLFVKTVSQGGEVQTVQRAFAGRVSYLGGAGISYSLTANDGVVIAAGMETEVRAKSFKRRNLAQRIAGEQ